VAFIFFREVDLDSPIDKPKETMEMDNLDRDKIIEDSRQSTTWDPSDFKSVDGQPERL